MHQIDGSGALNFPIMHFLIVKYASLSWKACGILMPRQSQWPNVDLFQIIHFSEYHCCLSVYFSFMMQGKIEAFYILFQAVDLGSDVCKHSLSLQRGMGQGLGDQATSVVLFYSSLLPFPLPWLLYCAEGKAQKASKVKARLCVCVQTIKVKDIEDGRKPWRIWIHRYKVTVPDIKNENQIW